ncbi:N-acetylglucosamine kinase [Streptomyces sp. KR80]|uniref:N-acetylglucosamine kinase n=1 Tax=Streptomyces sp. KR80 TaxID=3457426 RepID=UPI003FD0277C
MTAWNAPPTWVIGVDSGGSGVRVGLARAGDVKPLDTVVSREPVRTGPSGIDAGHLLEQVLPAARALLDRVGAAEPAAVAVGAAGMATLGEDLRAVLPGALAESLGVRRLALAADAVTAYAGALGQRPGAVVAAGTGLIALGAMLNTPVGPGRRGGRLGSPGAGPGTPGTEDGSAGYRATEQGREGSDSGAPDGEWRRADGWGHLLGDCGSGAWIGRAGLEAALRAYDGRARGSTPLLAALEAVFGPAPGLPEQLYPRTDRAALLASFAPEVARCAAHDTVAAGILAEAARSIAESAAAVCPPGEGGEVALTGGLLRIGEPLLAPLRAELARQLPYARRVEAAGDSLDGALCIAGALAKGNLVLPVDGRLLHLPYQDPSDT